MLRFILRKMASKKWMFLALLIGNILLSGIACSNPLYSGAVMQRMLSDAMDTYLTSKNAYPGVVSVLFSGSQKRNAELPACEEMALGVPRAFGVPAAQSVKHYYINSAQNTPVVEREDAKTSSIMLGALTDLPAHASLVAGRMFSDARREDGAIEVVVSQRGLIELNLLLGERRVFDRLTDAAGSPIVIEVVGVFDVKTAEDLYWVRTPGTYRTECLMAEPLFREIFMYEGAPNGVNAAWYAMLDTAQMKSQNADHMQDTVKYYQGIAKDASYLNININFSGLLTEHLAMKRKVSVTLWVLQAPIYILLAAFIFMVSRQILETEESEIAVLKSRGVRRGQITFMYFLQSLLLALAAVAAGVPLGSFITQVLGSSNAFLQFVSRRALPVEVGREAIAFALGAAVVAICAMVLPVRRFSRASIVTQKQKKHRGSRPFWQKAFLDVIALGVALYGLYSFNGQKAMIAQRILAGEVPDPLLFLCSSLFIIGAGLVAIRVIPLLISLVFHIFKRAWSPALYASFLKVLRQRANQDFIMIFLVMTIALGVFNAQTASSINVSAEENTRYMNGANLVVREAWESNSLQVADDPSLDLIYYEPDFGVYETMKGASGAAKVFRLTNVIAQLSGGNVKNVTLLAVDTDDFGNVLWFDDSLLPHHINEYLNAMSRNARAVLVSANFRDDYGYEIGDVINYQNASSDGTRGIIYGFVDYWPSYAPYTYQKGTDGVYKEVENHLIVANLSQVQDAMGVLPYEVWLKAENGADFMYEYAQNSGKLYAKFNDVDALIVEKKNDPMLKSLNGVLTVGFIVVLALCAIGFLMYWVLSIRQRTLQFGIFRAMGMSMGEIFGMLVNEQFCISVASILVGAVIGSLAAKLYMPLIQLAYASSDNALPLKTGVNAGSTYQLFILVGVMLLGCMAILAALIRRMKIAQALKLGED